MGAMSAAAIGDASGGLAPHIRLVLRYNLHPELDVHPSWLPAGWPARHRAVARFGPAGRAMLADALRRVQRKLPRRLGALPIPPLQPRQRRQLEELMLLGIVPDRLPQWDWLF